MSLPSLQQSTRMPGNQRFVVRIGLLIILMLTTVLWVRQRNPRPLYYEYANDNQNRCSSSSNRHSFRTSVKPCPKKNLTAAMGPRRPDSTEIRSPTPGTFIKNENLRSQNGEDKHLLSYFNGYCGGTYLEMGGLDGVHLSNSYVFNKEFGWKGVLVEMNPDLYKQLKKNRPKEIATVHAAVCNQEQTVHFYRDGPTGAIWEFTTPTFREKWWARSNGTLDKTIAVQCSPMRTLLQKHVGKTFFFDFFSLDIEGAEVQALESLDFDRFGFGFILVEADEHNSMKNMAARTLLEREGYFFLERWHRSDWFVNKEFASIYRDVMHHSEA